MNKINRGISRTWLFESVNSSPNAIIITNNKRKVTLWSETTEALFGWKTAEAT